MLNLSPSTPSTSSKIIIALDAMGGDIGPAVVLGGASRFIRDHNDISFVVYGDSEKINESLLKFSNLKEFCTVIHTDKKIESHDKPSTALRNSKDSSMRLAIESVKDGQASAAVSAGNTGALMALAMMILKPAANIRRPAIASIFPAPQGETIMLDLGANLIVEAESLVDFAILGAIFAKARKAIDKPTVGLLNVGSEETKGPDHVRAAAAILATLKFPGQYTGYVEGNDLLNGTVDVIVSDGYAGNIALKTMEGTAKTVAKMLKTAIKGDLLAMIGGILSVFAFRRFKKKADPRLYNGGVFLGLNGLCVKSHGGTDELGFASAIRLAYQLAKAGYIEQVSKEIQELRQA